MTHFSSILEGLSGIPGKSWYLGSKKGSKKGSIFTPYFRLFSGAEILKGKDGTPRDIGQFGVQKGVENGSILGVRTPTNGDSWKTSVISQKSKIVVRARARILYTYIDTWGGVQNHPFLGGISTGRGLSAQGIPLAIYIRGLTIPFHTDISTAVTICTGGQNRGPKRGQKWVILPVVKMVIFGHPQREKTVKMAIFGVQKWVKNGSILAILGVRFLPRGLVLLLTKLGNPADPGSVVKMGVWIC